MDEAVIFWISYALQGKQFAQKGGTIRLPADKKRRDDLSEFNFMKYAATYFVGNASSHYSKRPLKSSLLGLTLPTDEISAQAIWITILRFMGDTAEAKYDNDDDDDDDVDALDKTSKIPVMQRLTMSLSRNTVQSKEFQEAVASMAESDHQRLVRKTLKRKTKLPEILRKALDNSDEMEYYQQWLSTRSSNLEKLHFIIGHGILRPALRDEIFCQICKQLTNNPYNTSFAKGWILISLCIGCFPPSEKFQQYLRSFIRNGPELYAPYCENRLDRTIKNGVRTQPPSWLELQATRNKTSIGLNIILMDDSLRKIEVDSGSTAKEVVAQVATNMGLNDCFGFSVYIILFDKVMSLGNGREHIMDAISNCEQYAKEQGANDRKAPWKLYLRKEMYSPWYDPTVDALATQLIYRQVVRGIHFGEYRCKTDKDIAMIATLQYYSENGSEMDKTLLRKVIPDYLPKDLLLSGEKALQKWEKLILECFERNTYVRNKIPVKCAKEDIAIFAQINWPMMFSRFFEAVRTSGPKLLSDNLIMAINWTGVFLIDQTEQVLAEISYPEILSVSCEEDPDLDLDELFLNTVQKENFIFKCFDAKDITELINYILTNLKERSTYAVAVQNFESPPNSEGYLTLSKGDLITFEQGITGEIVLLPETTWSRGECNGVSGEFPTESIYVLPILTSPSDNIIRLFKEGTANPKNYKRTDYNTLQRKKMHTLKRYASENFRMNVGTSRVSQSIHAVRNRPDELWKHSRDPIKAPLLQKLQQEKKAFEHAVAIFSYILKYMGDMPRGRLKIDTGVIFKPTLENENLRDEVYCQIMRQLTENKIELSEERGWDLMWLATGIMYPSGQLLKELTEFLKSRTHPIAVDSLKRLQKTIKYGQRKHPPYIIEVEAIQNRIMQIYHKIYFPDDTVEAFEIESSTRAGDLCDAITKRLNVKTCDGLSLFVKILDKAFSVPEESYIFDFINELVCWLKETMPTRTADQQINCQYQLFFMKKLWLNTVPGKDKNADLIFYFPQEVPKYLNSYYKVSKEEAIKLGALLYRIQFAESNIPGPQFQDILPRLVPEDMIRQQKTDEWRKSITNAFNALDGAMDETEAKEMFLEHIGAYPTFGSTFFVVSQTNDGNLPDTILIAINCNGFNIIDPRSKEIIITYGFSQLNFWSSGNTYFHIRFGNMIGASKLLCTTTQGYKMDDLLSSYIKVIKSGK